MSGFYDIPVTGIDGSSDLLGKLRGKLALAVNVASRSRRHHLELREVSHRPRRLGVEALSAADPAAGQRFVAGHRGRAVRERT
jgi:glutathione peroxidase-family protein